MSELTTMQKRDLAARGYSRRMFGRAAALVTAGAALPFYNEPALAQLSMIGPLPPDAVKINANEYPLGPCPEAAEAIYGVVKKGGRYLYEETFTFARTLADQEGVTPDAVLAFAGSSDPLHRSVLAFTSPTRSLVMGDPGYEAGARAAEFVGAKVIRVPLRKDHSHDVRAMAAADPDAGLIYICNPNNPTGTVTSKADLDWLVANKPKGAIVLIDEAYIHFSETPASSYMVAAGKDVVVLRTFSKLYGMAGLRAGAAIARADLLAKIRPYGAGALPVTGMTGALTSLKVSNLVAERRKLNRRTRDDLFDFLTRHNFKFVPSESNCFMLDAKRPAQEMVKAMAAEKVFIGRVWPAWPTYTRITIGTPDEMEKFKAALLKVNA
ncbi:MAG: pyridoxal phosphate-dependent aminotransferase [Bryobacteraceae bacterium]|nr:pyridoxal phosphate-dependent aminotransferase [Bryobacteraceae bacterium]